MKILEHIKSKKVSRKNFIFYSGVFLAGAYMLIRQPFKLLKKNRDEKQAENYSKGIRFEINPEAVKRS
jgi:hypothetical protein